MGIGNSIGKSLGTSGTFTSAAGSYDLQLAPTINMPDITSGTLDCSGIINFGPGGAYDGDPAVIDPATQPWNLSLPLGLGTTITITSPVVPVNGITGGVAGDVDTEDALIQLTYPTGGLGTGPANVKYEFFNRTSVNNGDAVTTANTTFNTIRNVPRFYSDEKLSKLYSMDCTGCCESSAPQGAWESSGLGNFSEYYLHYAIKIKNNGYFLDTFAPGTYPTAQSIWKITWLTNYTPGNGGSTQKGDLCVPTCVTGAFRLQGNGLAFQVSKPGFNPLSIPLHWMVKFNEWTQIELSMKDNPSDVLNGWARVGFWNTTHSPSHFEVEGNQDVFSPNPWDPVNQRYWNTWGFNTYTALKNGGQPGQPLFDHLYFSYGANSNARVIMTEAVTHSGDSGDWYTEFLTTARHALQPIDSWNDDQVTIEMNKQDFSGENVDFWIFTGGYPESSNIVYIGQATIA